MPSSASTPRTGRLRPTLSAVVLAALVIVADRVTKHIVRADIGLRQTRKVIPGVVSLVHYRNSGVAFDFLSGAGVIVLVITAIALLALVAYFLLHPGRRGLWIPTGLLIGGAVGNLLDRLLNGSVTDFIKLPDWPAFNVADISITVGVIVLILVLELSSRSEARRSGAAARG
jgi:signal peptidase II